MDKTNAAHAGRSERVRLFTSNPLLKEVDGLPDQDQRTGIILMDSLIKRAKIDRILAA